jgi:thymidylate kinase
MMGGTTPGAGKTTLMEALAAAFSTGAGSACMALTEDDVWGKRQLGLAPVDHRSARPEFVRLLDPTASYDERAAGLVDAFLSAVARANAMDALWLQDWVWSDLARACLRDGGTPTAADVTRELVKLAREGGVQATVLFLHVHPEVALRRALAERGQVWLNRHLGADVRATVDTDRLTEVAQAYGRGVAPRRQQLSDDGWKVADISAAGPVDQVVASAVAALDLRHGQH